MTNYTNEGVKAPFWLMVSEVPAAVLGSVNDELMVDRASRWQRLVAEAPLQPPPATGSKHLIHGFG